MRHLLLIPLVILLAMACETTEGAEASDTPSSTPSDAVSDSTTAPTADPIGEATVTVNFSDGTTANATITFDSTAARFTFSGGVTGGGSYIYTAGSGMLTLVIDSYQVGSGPEIKPQAGDDWQILSGTFDGSSGSVSNGTGDSQWSIDLTVN